MVRRKSISQEMNQELSDIIKQSNKHTHWLRRWFSPGSRGVEPEDDSSAETDKDGVEVAFKAFNTYKYFEFPDITRAKLVAMTNVKENPQDYHGSSLEQRLSWPQRSASRLRLCKMLYFVAFYNFVATPTFTSFGYEMSQGLQTLQVFVYLVFAFDLVANFFTSHYAADGHEVFNLHLSARRYVLSWFAVDLLAALPCWWYQDRDVIEANFKFDWGQRTHHPLTGASAVQIVGSLLKMMRETHRLRSVGIVNESEIWNTSWKIGSVFGFLHVFTVIFFLCAQVPTSVWFEHQKVGEVAKEAGFNVFQRYIVFLHAAVVFVTGKGEPTCTAERIYAIVANLLSLFLTSILVGEFTHIIQKSRAKELKWRIKVGEINDSMQKMGVNEDLQVKIRNYYAFSWAINGGEDRNYKWLGDLSRQYEGEAKIQVNEKLIASVPIFKEANRDFVHAVIMKLQQQLYLPGDVIIKCGEIGDEMFFVVRGTVQAMNLTETMVYTVLREGSFFGEIALLKKNSRRTATVRAYTYAHLNVLYKTDFEIILREFPEDAALLRKEAELREINSQNVEKMQRRRLQKDNSSSSSNTGTSKRSGLRSRTESHYMAEAQRVGKAMEEGALGPVAMAGPRKSSSTRRLSSSGKGLLSRAMTARSSLLQPGKVPKMASKGKAVKNAQMAAKSNKPVQHNTIFNLDADGEMETFDNSDTEEVSPDALLAALQVITMSFRDNDETANMAAAKIAMLNRSRSSLSSLNPETKRRLSRSLLSTPVEEGSDGCGEDEGTAKNSGAGDDGGVGGHGGDGGDGGDGGQRGDDGVDNKPAEAEAEAAAEAAAAAEAEDNEGMTVIDVDTASNAGT